jgi:hypothetical protein
MLHLGRHLYRRRSWSRCCGRSRSGRWSRSLSWRWVDAIDLAGLRAVLGDMTDLAASVAGFPALVGERASIRRSTVPGDVAELAASVALHGLSLAIASIVIWPAALVARSSARNTAISASEASEAAAARAAAATTTASAASADSLRGILAVTLKRVK